MKIVIIFITATDKGEIVAMGTGNSCMAGEYVTIDGRSLLDSYAVAAARRALLK